MELWRRFVGGTAATVKRVHKIAVSAGYGDFDE
jgi:hypothetical protein